MIDAIVKVMVEVLSILAIATKEIKENRASELILEKNRPSAEQYLETYLKKLVPMGGTDMEDALLRLENAILEETQMAAAEALKGVHVLQNRMKSVEDMLQGVVDGKMKNITTKDIKSAKITVQLVMFATHDVFMVRCRREHDKSDDKRCGG